MQPSSYLDETTRTIPGTRPLPLPSQHYILRESSIFSVSIQKPHQVELSMRKEESAGDRFGYKVKSDTDTGFSAVIAAVWWHICLVTSSLLTRVAHPSERLLGFDHLPSWDACLHPLLSNSGSFHPWLKHCELILTNHASRYDKVTPESPYLLEGHMRHRDAGLETEMGSKAMEFQSRQRHSS